MKHAYKEYGEAQTDLVKRIRNIHDELVLLARLIAHGEQFEPNENLLVADYKASIANQIDALSEMLRASEFGIDHLDISDRVAQFSAESLAAIDMLEKMKDLPDLDEERMAFEALTGNFDEFAESLNQDPSRPEILKALKATEGLLAAINKQIEAVRGNPLVSIAECWSNGAVAVNALGVSVKNTPQR